MSTGFDTLTNITARFVPKNLTTLRDAMKPLIGKIFEWEYAGVQDDNAAFAGQTTWMIARRHDSELPEACRGRWVPEEDLEIVKTENKNV